MLMGEDVALKRLSLYACVCKASRDTFVTMCVFVLSRETMLDFCR